MSLVSLDTLVAGVRAGKLASFPTDTVPALASLPEQGALIYEAKQRSRDKPLILMAASADEAWSFVQGSDEEYKIWQSVAKKYWPGALTLVFPASAQVPRIMISMSHENLNQNRDRSSEFPTVGIRVPNCTIAQAILARTGPLATTSANLSSQPPLETIAEIEAQFPDLLNLAATEYSHETLGTGVPSTVAKWTGKNWQILREGAIKLEF